MCVCVAAPQVAICLLGAFVSYYYIEQRPSHYVNIRKSQVAGVHSRTPLIIGS